MTNVEGYLFLDNREESRENILRRTFREMAETVITAVLIFLALQITTQSFLIEGESMMPTLQPEQRLLVNRFVYAKSETGIFGEDEYIFHGPQRGDVIVFRPPTGQETDFVKRVIGVPGDVVDIRDGKVYVNGVEMDYVDVATTTNGSAYPITVPDGEYYVLGDNRRRSSDSRSWGFVHEDDIVGRAWITYWPAAAFKLFS